MEKLTFEEIEKLLIDNSVCDDEDEDEVNIGVYYLAKDSRYFANGNESPIREPRLPQDKLKEVKEIMGDYKVVEEGDAAYEWYGETETHKVCEFPKHEIFIKFSGIATSYGDFILEGIKRVYPTLVTVTKYL